MNFLAALALTLQVDAPASLASAADRIRAVDLQRLASALRTAGLDSPPAVNVTLVPEDDPSARDVPRWIVGRAFATTYIVILPQRITRYPYDSLESVLRHEIVHLALTATAGGQPVPRWFHEGVATSVEAGWGVTDQLRLVIAATTQPSIDDVNVLFRSDAQYETELAYLLATALVNDLRERHGPDLPGRIARRMPASAVAPHRGATPDVRFARAFIAETGETPQQAAGIAWRSYRAWSRWIPALVSGTAIWSFIILLASLAFLARRRRRRQLHDRWRNEERTDL